MLMQGCFCCLQSGLVRVKNSINVAIKNVVDFCLSWAAPALEDGPRSDAPESPPTRSPMPDRPIRAWCHAMGGAPGVSPPRKRARGAAEAGLPGSLLYV